MVLVTWTLRVWAAKALLALGAACNAVAAGALAAGSGCNRLARRVLPALTIVKS